MECSGSASAGRYSDTPPLESRPRTKSREPPGTFSFFRSSVGFLDLHVHFLSGFRWFQAKLCTPSAPLKHRPQLSDIFHALQSQHLIEQGQASRTSHDWRDKVTRFCNDLLPRHGIVRRSAHVANRSEEHTSELQSLAYLVCRLLLEKKKK